MSLLVSIIAAIVGAAIGYAAALFIALGVMSLLGVSDFEGKRAMMAAFLFGPLGGIAGLAAGLWIARSFAAKAGGGIGWTAPLTILILIAIVATGVFWMLSNRPLGQNGAAPRMAFEIRVPAAAGLVKAGDMVKVTLDTDQNQMPADLTPGTPRQDGAWILVTGEVELYFRTSQRLLVADFGAKGQHVFRLDLPATPPNADDWSAWQPVDHVFTDPAQTTGAPPKPGEVSELRQRVTVY